MYSLTVTDSLLLLLMIGYRLNLAPCALLMTMETCLEKLRFLSIVTLKYFIEFE